MGGKEVKAKEIVQYYKSYMEIFKGNTMPEPKSMLEVAIYQTLPFCSFFQKSSFLSEI